MPKVAVRRRRVRLKDDSQTTWRRLIHNHDVVFQPGFREASFHNSRQQGVADVSGVQHDESPSKKGWRTALKRHGGPVGKKSGAESAHRFEGGKLGRNRENQRW